jgi:hypothetical protein
MPTDRNEEEAMTSSQIDKANRFRALHHIPDDEISGSLEKATEMALKDLPAAQKPDAELSKDEAFSEELREALLHNLAILRRPIDWDNIEILKLKTTVALSVQSQAVRLRVAELSPRSDDGVVSRLMERVARLRRDETVIEMPDAKTVEPGG